MTDLVERLREIGAHYSACDRQQTIYEAADALEAAKAQASTQIDPDMPAQQLRLHMGELTASEIRVARAAIAWANTAAQAQAAEIAALLGSLWNWPEDPGELTGASFDVDEITTLWKAYRMVTAIRALTDAAKGDRT